MRVPAWVVVALGCVGCTTPEKTPNAAASTSAPEPPAATAAVTASGASVPVRAEPGPPRVQLAVEDARYLASSGVTRGDYLRREFFTWTTKTQLNQLKSGRRLLIKDRADDGSRAFFDRRLELMRSSSDLGASSVARRLLEKDLGLRRFAWVNPWGTSRGWGESPDYAPDQADELALALAETDRSGALSVNVTVPFGVPIAPPAKKHHRPPGWRKRIMW